MLTVALAVPVVDVLDVPVRVGEEVVLAGSVAVEEGDEVEVSEVPSAVGAPFASPQATTASATSAAAITVATREPERGRIG